MNQKRSSKNLLRILLIPLFVLMMNPASASAGLFGAPQTVSRASGGLNTAIGYWYHEDTYENGIEHEFRQNQIYSQAAYGAKNIWEIYARVGISDLKIPDVFRSADADIVGGKKDFEENWEFFGTLGAKAYYPVSNIFGAGAFIQGTYFFSHFTDNVSGVSGGVPFTTDMKIKHLRDINCGVAVQATVPLGIRLYAGPYLYYSEAEVSPSYNIAGLGYGTGHVTVENKSIVGGFAGMDIPLMKGFRLNIEGQYSEKFSAGAAISFTY